MEFDWDDDKDGVCRGAYGFGFEDALGIFLGDTVEWRDDREDYGEVRMITVGEWDSDFYTIVYTDRGSTRRIITAWPSEREERQLWERSL